MPNKVIGVLLMALVAMVVLQIYMGMSTTANTTGWDATLVSMTTAWWPLLLGVAVLIGIISVFSMKHKG